MKTFLLFLFVSIPSFFMAQTAQIPDKVNRQPTAPKSFVKLPEEGFKSVEDMAAFADSSLHGGGSVEEMSVAGDIVWVMKRSISWGGSTAEFTFFTKKWDRFVPVFAMPMTIGEFRAEQRDREIVLTRADLREKKFIDVLRIFHLP